VSRLSTSFVLGYHGCDKEIGEKVLAGSADFIYSDNDYDWLGPGVYFWEADPLRALEWARSKAARVAGKIPYVIGAVIDLRNCLDLTVRENIELLRDAYQGLVATRQKDGKRMPTNRDLLGDAMPDKRLRDLDCAVIRYLHDEMEQELLAGGRQAGFERFDTVRGLFREGSAIYPGSGFHDRTHTQIAVRSAECIKGIFRYPVMIKR